MKIWLYSRGDGRRKNNRMILITVWSNLLRMCIHVQVFHSCFHLSIWEDFTLVSFLLKFLRFLVRELWGRFPCLILGTFPNCPSSWNVNLLPPELSDPDKFTRCCDSLISADSCLWVLDLCYIIIWQLNLAVSPSIFSLLPKWPCESYCTPHLRFKERLKADILLLINICSDLKKK